MRRTAPVAALLLLPAALAAQGRRPNFAQPTLPPPSITEYQPRSTLVVPENPVPRAKYPVVDLHGHPPSLADPATIERVVAAMDDLNLQVIVQARGSSGSRLTRQIEAVRAAGHADRFVFFTTIDLRNVGPGSGARIAAQLEEDVRAGAVGIGEIGKQFGLTTRKADGTRLQLDDPELDIVWETAARVGIPVFVHTADPAEFFQPLDYENERWLELAIFPNRRFFDRERFPSFEELMAERDRMLAKHPNTTWVLAHMGWPTQDLARWATSSTASRTSTARSAPFSKISGASPASRASSSSGTRTASSSARIPSSRMSIPTTGASSRPRTSTSTTTGTTTPSGSSTEWGFRMTCCARCTTRTRYGSSPTCRQPASPSSESAGEAHPGGITSLATGSSRTTAVSSSACSRAR